MCIVNQTFDFFLAFCTVHNLREQKDIFKDPLGYIQQVFNANLHQYFVATTTKKKQSI